MNELNFKWRYKDYELRACPKRLVKFEDDEQNETIDLIKWDKHSGDDKEYCFSLAYWTKDKEGYDLKLVGSRIFEYIDEEDVAEVWKQLKVAQKILDAFFESTR